jgi:hypothetical protein
MTPITSALKTGPPRSKGYRLQTLALLGLAVLAIVIAARLLNHHAVAPPVSQARAVQPKQLGVQPNPEQNPTTSRDASRVTSP